MVVPVKTLVDLYCGEGGASVGYHRAGFRVIGIDKEPQPNYPFQFIRGDALDTSIWPSADVYTASPPCKRHTSLRAFSAAHHLDLIAETRSVLAASGLPYVIENVPGAPLHDPIMLCGSMFDLGVRRHRLFESNMQLTAPWCDHKGQAERSPGYMVARYHSGVRENHWSPVIGVYGRGQGLGPGEIGQWRRAMGIDWMSRDGMREAIPPAYTQHIGAQII